MFLRQLSIFQRFFINRKYFHISQNHKRCCSSSANIKIVNLTSLRSVVSLSGIDTLPYLQGLITNDIAHLQSKSSIYALFLNHLGRVLYDCLIFNSGSQSLTDELLVECDNLIVDDLIKYLNKFKLRKKIVVKKKGELEVLVLFNDDLDIKLMSEDQNQEAEIRKKNETLVKKAVDSLSLPSNSKYFLDPRIHELGYRLLLPKEESGDNLSKKLGITLSPLEDYMRLRYALGVAEGCKELPTGNCFPLESNGDYLHGISFQKGCYIGQELTARTHHTGVVRKRIMPIRLNGNQPISDNTEVSLLNPANAKKSLGKLRGINGNLGIGLIRVEDALNSPELKLGSVDVTLCKPFWWAKKEIHKL